MQDFTEEGMGLVPVYGKTTDEVLEKLARTNLHAQETLARRASAPTQSGTAQVPPQAPAAAPRRSISADDVMRATADLQNPAKAGEAIGTLIEAQTGVNPVDQARRNYALLALHWEEQNPDFYRHPGNRQLVGNKAIRLAGGKPGAVTEAVLTQAFTELQAEGLLFEEPGEQAPARQQPQPSTTFPGENRVQGTERPRGTRFSTGIRSTGFSAPQTVQTKALRYTEEQIRTMSEKERMRVFNDPDYIKACDFYYREQSA
jgi:hypothetical protein